MADRKAAQQPDTHHELELRACAEIERLPGVVAAAAWLAPDGRLHDSRIHILPGAAPSVIAHASARVLQSLGIAFDAVDIRITTVAAPDGVHFADPGARRGAGRALLLHDISLSRAGAHVKCRAQLLRNGEPATGEASELDTAAGRLRCAAAATLRAAEDAAEQVAFGLEGASIVSLFGRSYAAVSVEAAVGRRVAILSGFVAVDPGRPAEEAVCLATLRAIDRWIGGHDDQAAPAPPALQDRH
jgi:hypothetical protein